MGRLALRIRASVRRIIPGRLLVCGIYPALEKCESVKRNILRPALESISLSLAAFAQKIMLRLPGPPARSIGILDEHWSQRIADAIACPDNNHIPRCANAGMLDGSCIVMHNGLKVRALGYYGEGMLNLLLRNRGVHESQEERAFSAVLPFLPPQAVMVELGAYWGFYSLWFAAFVDRARCYLYEPDPRNLEAGRQNFKLNGLSASFSRYAVGNQFSTQLKSARVLSLGDILQRAAINHVNLLHADIQGAELDMLNGSRDIFDQGLIDYVFLSTHADSLHYACRDYLLRFGYTILCDANMSESYSMDGVIVAKRGGVAGPNFLTISKKPRPFSFQKEL